MKYRSHIGIRYIIFRAKQREATRTDEHRSDWYFDRKKDDNEEKIKKNYRHQTQTENVRRNCHDNDDDDCSKFGHKHDYYEEPGVKTGKQDRQRGEWSRREHKKKWKYDEKNNGRERGEKNKSGRRKDYDNEDRIVFPDDDFHNYHQRPQKHSHHNRHRQFQRNRVHHKGYFDETILDVNIF